MPNKSNLYLGNHNLKASNVPQEFTKKQVEEYLKCASDPLYFIKRYVKIITLDEGLQPFEPWDFQEDLLRKVHDNRFVICKFPRQTGKALSLDTPINTPLGWKTMGEIEIGDEVYGADGKPTNVIMATDVMHNHECYEVEFDNGEIITADKEHLWNVECSDWSKTKTLTTEQILEYLPSKLPDRPIYINIAKSLEKDDIELPIQPYTLGVWLGDGYSSSGRYISEKNDNKHIKKKIINEGYDVAKPYQRDNCEIQTIYNLQTTLKECDVFENKRIPRIYFDSSIKQRLELLRGLMDTDGYCDKRTGSCEFYQKSFSLITEVRELISGLGMKSRISSKNINGQVYYTIIFSNKIHEVFSLPRKSTRQKLCSGHPKNNRHYIRRIEKTNSVPVRCIQVDNEDKLFLCGRTMIPTHNSTTMISYLLHYILFNPEVNVAILANKLATARELLNRLKLAYEHLPKWLQQGIEEWNKTNIELENNSKIIAAATSSSAVRGGSYNCISGNSKITIRNTKTGEIINTTIGEFYANSSRGLEQRNEICEWEVYTDRGFRKFYGVSKTHNQQTIRIETEVDEIVCTPDHKIATIDGFIEAKEISYGSKIQTTDGFVDVVCVEDGDKTDVYDLLNVEETHSFYANGLLVHNCIMLDEFAYVPPGVAEEFFSSVYPTISSGKDTKVLIVSTPKGLNMFYKMWIDATEGRSEYIPIEVHWNQVPGRDEKWKQQTIANTSEEQFRCEFECDFIGSTQTLIDAKKLKCLTWKTPAEKTDDGIKIYEKSKEDHQYVMCVDVSRGKELDYHAITVVDITETPYKVVCTFRNNTMSPMVLPNLVFRIGNKYNTAHALIEINDIGAQVADILHHDLEYDNILVTSVRGRKGQTLDGGFGSAQSQLGVRTTKAVKRLGCSIIKSMVEEDKILIEDFDTIEEMVSFVAKANSYEAEKGHHDDLMMTLVLFGWLTTQSYFKDLTNFDLRKNLFQEKIQKLEDELTPFGFIDDGINMENGPTIDIDGDAWFGVRDDNRNHDFKW